MIRAAGERAAQAALRLWPGADPTSLTFIGLSANSVYAVRIDGAACYLRLTDGGFRSRADVDAELAFVGHLQRCGVAVSLPRDSCNGALAEELVGDNGATFVAAIFSAAQGVHVTPDGSDWDEPFFRCWGRSLARMHQAARQYAEPADGWRSDWRLEPVLKIETARLRTGDPALGAAIDRIFEELEGWGAGLGDMGMIHADYGPQNFRYDRRAGITAFDFDNCCRHWLLYDIAVSLYALRAHPRCDVLRSWILAGYQEVAALPGDPAAMGALFGLRLLYILCDRAFTAGPQPTAAQAMTVDSLRQQVLSWPAREST
jgi:Ser/Thr protein kinase RdoA (MazF antagonist)